MRTYAGLAAILPLVSSASGAPARAVDAPSCASAEYRALGFSIGTWHVSDPNGNSRGTAAVTYELDGCAVIERWTAPDGHSGTNIDAYSSDDKRWHRLFVDNKAHVHVFAGSSSGASIDYQGTSKGPGGEDVLNRLSIDARGPDKMVQFWQQSSDGGKTWNVIFRDLYVRVKNG